jgi:hypothetical protein
MGGGGVEGGGGGSSGAIDNDDDDATSSKFIRRPTTGIMTAHPVHAKPSKLIKVNISYVNFVNCQTKYTENGKLILVLKQ